MMTTTQNAVPTRMWPVDSSRHLQEFAQDFSSVLEARHQNLLGKTALVTGGSRGIGRSIAFALARQGATVFVHYNAKAAEAHDVVNAIKTGGGNAHALCADFSLESGATDLTEALTDVLHLGTGHHGLDILVNNAGIGLRARIDQVTPTDFDRVMQVNFKTPFFLIQKCLPILNDDGRIINISSMGTRAAYPEMSVYAPAKAALESLTLLLASELGVRGITVNAVLPGATVTDLNPRARDPELSQYIIPTVALKRVGQPEDIAEIVTFLASPQGGWITGQKIDASGGQRL